MSKMPHCNKKMLSFFLTTRCNLCCRYCYNAKERSAIEEKTLSLDVAINGVDWYFANNDSRHIRFYGPGEPTQEFDLMKKITAYAKGHFNGGERVTVEIQTNGVFTREICEWALDNCNIMWMSFDGIRTIQEYNRPLNPKYSKVFHDKTSAEVLEHNVKWLNKNKGFRNLMVGARVTITDDNAKKQIDIIDYFYDLGIRYVWTNPLFYAVGKVPVCFDEGKKQAFHFDMNAYIDNYIDAYYYARNKGMFWGSFLTVNFDGESEYHCRCCEPLSAPHLTPDGYISACDMVVLGEKPYHMDPFIVGKWNPNTNQFDFDSRKIEKLNSRRSTSLYHCKDCPAMLHCGGYCAGEIVNETGCLDGYNAGKCAAIQRLYKELGLSTPYPYLHP